MRNINWRPFHIALAILDTLAVILFLVLFVAAIAPSIGLDLFPKSWSDQLSANVPRLTLGALAFIACNLLVERIRTSSIVLRKLDVLTQTTSDVASKLATHLSTARVFSNREQGYACLREHIVALPSRSHVLVTHFEKNRSARYDTGERAQEAEFMQLWSRLIKSDHLDVKQLVHVSSQFDLDEVMQRLKTYSGCRNYELGILVGNPVLPYQDLIVAEDLWIHFALPSDPQNPRAERLNVFIESPEIAGAFATAFRACWGASEIRIIKSGGQEDTRGLEELRELLPTTNQETTLPRYKQVPCELAALGQTGEMIEEFLSQVTGAKNKSRAELFWSASQGQIGAFLNSFRNENLWTCSFTGIEASQSLIETINAAKRQILAVSVDLTSKPFWSTDAGREFLRANQEAGIRGIQISRLFVVKDRKDKVANATIKDHQAFASCRSIEASKANDSRDFMIVDDELLYEVLEEHDGVITSCKMSIDPIQVSDLASRFRNLWNIAEEPKAFFKGRPSLVMRNETK